MTRSGYEAPIVLAFVEHHTVDGELNGRRVNAAHRQMLDRWRHMNVVPLDRLDKFLMGYGLMIWELEHYSRQTFARDGFYDPLVEQQLVG